MAYKCSYSLVFESNSSVTVALASFSSGLFKPLMVILLPPSYFLSLFNVLFFTFVPINFFSFGSIFLLRSVGIHIGFCLMEAGYTCLCEAYFDGSCFSFETVVELFESSLNNNKLDISLSHLPYWSVIKSSNRGTLQHLLQGQESKHAGQTKASASLKSRNSCF